MATSWNAVLDVLEERVEEHRRVLEGAPAAPDYELPGDLGPLPLELVGRACAILARQQALEAELESRMDSLRNLFRRRATVTPIPLYLDEHA